MSELTHAESAENAEPAAARSRTISRGVREGRGVPVSYAGSAENAEPAAARSRWCFAACCQPAQWAPGRLRAMALRPLRSLREKKPLERKSGARVLRPLRVINTLEQIRRRKQDAE